MNWNDNFLYKYSAKIKRVLDGDTIHVMLDLGCRQYVYKEIRVVGLDGTPFDAPEIKLYKGVTEEEKELGLEAKAKAEEIFPIDSEIRIISHKDSTGKYGRLLATPFFKDENAGWTNYVDFMIAKGYYNVDK